MNASRFLLPIFGLCVALTPVVNGPRPSAGQSSTSKTLELVAFGARKGNVALKPVIVDAYAKLPPSFEENGGQTDSSVKFLSRGRGYTLFLTGSGEAVLALHKNMPKRTALGPAAPSPAAIVPESEPVDHPAVVRMKLVGEKTMPQVEGLDQMPGKANYFIGNDPRKWRTNVPTFGKVRYREVYPGVDLLYYGNHRQLEHDFIVAPGADPSSIVLSFAGAKKLLIDAQGRLVLRVKEGRIRFEEPRVYQYVGGARREISGSYVLKSAHRAGFAVGAYDATMPLVIDPVLVYSTYLGGSGEDEADSIAVDSSGNAYVTGRTASSDFPLASPIQATNAGGFDAFVTKLNAAGTALVYSTYLGGSGVDTGDSIAVDSSGNVYISGHTNSSNLPTVNSIQATYTGGPYEAFVAKVNATGNALVYSTYLGGNGDGAGYGIAVDSSGNAYVVGETNATNFPTVNPIQAANGGDYDAFVAKLNAAGTALVYSTYLGGSATDYGQAIAVDSSGNAYVAGYTNSTNFPTVNPIQAANGGGYDAFVAKLNAAGSALVYSTYLGGSGVDLSVGISVDSSGNAYVAGYTNSADFPTAIPFQAANGGGWDAFVTKLNSAGSALVYSTYLGGSGDDFVLGRIAVDSSGNAYVTGRTTSTNFPTVNPIQAANGGGYDAFVTKLNSAGSALVYSTYLGGSGDDEGFGIVVDSSGNAYVTGYTNSTNFPTANPIQAANAGSFDAFVAKIAPTSPTTLVMGPQAMEGNLALNPGDTLRVGYDFTMPGSHPLATVSFLGARVTFAWTCASGSGSGIFVVSMADQNYTDPQNSSNWYPSGDQHSSLVYQGAITVPNVCSGGLVSFQAGGTFSTGISSTDTENKVNVRWHYSGNGSAGSWSGTKSVVP